MYIVHNIYMLLHFTSCYSSSVLSFFSHIFQKFFTESSRLFLAVMAGVAQRIQADYVKKKRAVIPKRRGESEKQDAIE